MANTRHRTIKRTKKKFKHIAAALAGAAILTGVMMPAAPADATASQPDNQAPFTTEQSVADTGHPAQQPVKENVGGETSNAPSHFEKVLNIKATAYAPGYHDNQQWGEKTFLGTQVRPGIIAVDPKIIPLGSRVYIEFPDGHGQYAVAEDTGGAIKGHRIDIATTSVEKANDFGIKQVKVYIVDSQNA